MSLCFFVQLVLCPVSKLFNIIESQAWWINSWNDPWIKKIENYKNVQDFWVNMFVKMQFEAKILRVQLQIIPSFLIRVGHSVIQWWSSKEKCQTWLNEKNFVSISLANYLRDIIKIIWYWGLLYTQSFSLPIKPLFRAE